jgi:hypothetical protein
MPNTLEQRAEQILEVIWKNMLRSNPRGKADNVALILSALTDAKAEGRREALDEIAERDAGVDL